MPSSASVGSIPIAPASARLAADIDRQPGRIQRTVAGLTQWFGSEFSLVDGLTGELLHVPPDHAPANWAVRSELCREVARRGRPEFIEDDDPWLALAIPLVGKLEECLVAVGCFVTRPAGTDDLDRLAEASGMQPPQAQHWAARQTPLSADTLRRIAPLAAAKLAADQTIEQLGQEVEQLSVHLGTTYEEISLLYRLTQNLKLSSNDEELGQRALAWLAEVVPAEGLALQFIANSEPDLLTSDSRKEPVLLTHGSCPLAIEQFSQLVEHLGLSPSSRPLVINRSATAEPGWATPAVRELVIVPVAEGDRLFGWLAAFNQVHAAEFGTAEASLLSSVGTMLGIHSGNIDLYRQQAELLTGLVRAMTSAIDAKDPYTRGHSDRVARVAVRLAQDLGCDAETLKTLYFSGLLHDIGKIGINDEVLRKPGKLTDAEFEHIKTHVEIGYRILVDVRKLAHMLPVVLHHHESYDGRGYPYGLAGENIPYLARIVAVADAYDAMASDRPYRAGMEDFKLDAIIRAGAGQQWDPRVVEAFFRVRDDIRAISGRGPKKNDELEPRWS
ncbi:MAG: HD domain-containing phosphohydrolase [Pirellulales bacterium]